MSYCSVRLAAISIDSCITDTPFLSHISNNVPSSTYLYNGRIVLKSFVQTRKHLGPDNVLAVFPHWDDQNGNIHFLFLLVELCLIEMSPFILKYVRATHTTVAYLVTNDD